MRSDCASLPVQSSVWPWLLSGLAHLFVFLILLTKPAPEPGDDWDRGSRKLRVQIVERPRPSKPTEMSRKTRPKKRARLSSAEHMAEHQKELMPRQLPIAEAHEHVGADSETWKGYKPSAEAAESSNENENFLADVRQKIAAQKSYPYAARRLGLEGAITLSFLIDEMGHVKNVAVESSSAGDILQKSALDSLAKASPFTKPREAITIRIRLVYELREVDAPIEVAQKKEAH